MTHPTPAELREAALLFFNWYGETPGVPDEKEEAGYMLATYYLSHFPADGAEPITAETLERHGFATLDGMSWNHKQLTGTFCFEHDALSWWHTGNRTAVIANNHQFAQLMEALQLRKIKQVSGCSNTH